MTPSEAREIGRKARRQSQGLAASLNSQIMAEIKRRAGPCGTSVDILTAFNQGWTEENLKDGA